MALSAQEFQDKAVQHAKDNAGTSTANTKDGHPVTTFNSALAAKGRDLCGMPVDAEVPQQSMNIKRCL